MFTLNPPIAVVSSKLLVVAGPTWFWTPYDPVPVAGGMK